MALYEMNRTNANLSEASRLVDAALDLESHNSSIKHTKAEVLLRRADGARTPLELETRLRECREIVLPQSKRRGSSPQELSYSIHTLAKIGLKRLEHMLNPEKGESNEGAIETAIREVEEALSDGLQRLPGDSYLLDAEARLAQMLQNSERALAAMEKAFEANPRNAYIASRLAKGLLNQDEVEKAAAVLRRALDANRNDRRLHFEYARLLATRGGGSGAELEYHFSRSFFVGDSNYEAQLLYGRQLFLNEKFDESKRVFDRLGESRMSNELKLRAQYPLADQFLGTIRRSEATYALVERDGSADWVFAHTREIDRSLWDRLEVGARVGFKVAFNMRGPIAVEVRDADLS